MLKILLTGSTGFIGSNILNEIKNNNKVFIIKRSKSKKKISKNKNIKLLKFSNYKTLSNKLKKIKVDIIIHCATHYKKNHKFNDIEKFIESNILLGNVILENLNNLKPRKFLNFSSTWEDSNGIKDNPANLYAAYKKSFGFILKYYKKKNPGIKFFDIIIGDTFGKNDSRSKLINTLIKNHKINKQTDIVSKRLFLNLLNVEDIVSAIKIIVYNNIPSGKYLLKNPKYFNIYKLINYLNLSENININARWLSDVLIRNKIFSYKSLKSWKPKKSNIKNIKDLF